MNSEEWLGTLKTTMKIYTKAGDAGQTALYGGAKVPKDHLRIRAYGSLDETNAVLGIVLAESQGLPESLKTGLLRIQNELFQLGAELATPRGGRITTALIEEPHIEALEKEIDAMEAVLSPLKTFILPGGARAAAYLHLARTVVRRSERELVVLHRAEPCRDEVLKYVNRLSDYFFVCARFANHSQKQADVPWVAPKAKV